MKIDSIQMSKIKTDNSIFVLPKGMYKGAGITLEKAAEKIFSDTSYGSTNKLLNKSDVASLIWFLEYKA